MPFFSIPFPDLLLIAHSQWEGDSRCKLRIFTKSESAEKFLADADLPNDESQALSDIVSVFKEPWEEHWKVLLVEIDGDVAASLSEESKEYWKVPLVEIDGDAAASLSHAISIYHNKVKTYALFLTGPLILRFLEPLEGRKGSCGIIMWFDPDDGYRVAIVYSKEQAEGVIQRLLWLNEEERKSRLKKIRKWSIIRRTSKPPQNIGGPTAQLLCVAVSAKKWLEEEEERSRLH